MLNINYMNSKTIITGIGNRKDFHGLLEKNPGLIIIKFGAVWCGPCKKIAPLLDGFFTSSPDNVLCCDIDVDESIDLYAYLKHKKMINGIPVILCYKKGNTSFIPDDSITGAVPNDLDAFFKRCSQHLRSII